MAKKEEVITTQAGSGGPYHCQCTNYRIPDWSNWHNP